ncbi:hypothetical protein RKD55_002014 [Rossellomorea marisflavi]
MNKMQEQSLKRSGNQRIGKIPVTLQTLMIFKNVVDVYGEGDRLLLLVGGDHIWMLKSLFEGGGWKVINPFAGE